jgi:hypothetical protein
MRRCAAKKQEESIKMIGRIVKLAVAGVAALGLSVAAQAQGMPGPHPGAMERGSFAFERMVGGFGGKVVTGAPFSAQVTRETVQVLSNGTRVDRKMTGSVDRDSAGRTRQEMTLSSIGPLSASGQPPHIAFIRDPAAGKAYILNEDKQTVFTMNRPARAGANGQNRWAAGQNRENNGEQNPNVQTTSLGTKTIDGLTVQGTKVTRTIPAGRIGNDKAIVITREEWYSTDLQMVVSSTRTDPRFGTTTYQLTNVNRSEPSETLFTVPAGYSAAPQRFHGPQAQPQANPEQN